MAIKIGWLEIGYRSLVSLTVIALTYGYWGSHLCTLIRYQDYLNTAIFGTIAIAAAVAIPLSLGGLLAAIAAIVTVYFSSGLNQSLLTLGTCLGLYVLSFTDIRYEAAPEKKLSLIEILATIVTIIFMIASCQLILQNSVSWLNSVVIGAIAAAITLIGKQLLDNGISPKRVWRFFGILTLISLAIGFAIQAIAYAVIQFPTPS